MSDLSLYLIEHISFKYGPDNPSLDTADTGVKCNRINIFDLEVPFITPGGVPGVLDQPVV